MVFMAKSEFELIRSYGEQNIDHIFFVNLGGKNGNNPLAPLLLWTWNGLPTDDTILHKCEEKIEAFRVICRYDLLSHLHT